MQQALLEFLRDQRASSAIEYGLVVALISLAVFASFGQVGITVKAVYFDIAEMIDAIIGV